jgi:hypothetical protein
MASVLMVDEYLNRDFIVFSEAPENTRNDLTKAFDPQPDNFLI